MGEIEGAAARDQGKRGRRMAAPAVRFRQRKVAAQARQAGRKASGMAVSAERFRHGSLGAAALTRRLDRGDKAGVRQYRGRKFMRARISACLAIPLDRQPESTYSHRGIYRCCGGRWTGGGDHGEPVAIIGIACCFPGARDRPAEPLAPAAGACGTETAGGAEARSAARAPG